MGGVLRSVTTLAASTVPENGRGFKSGAYRIDGAALKKSVVSHDPIGAHAPAEVQGAALRSITTVRLSSQRIPDAQAFDAAISGAGLSSEQVARRLEITQQAVDKMRRGEIAIELRHLRALPTSVRLLMRGHVLAIFDACGAK